MGVPYGTAARRPQSLPFQRGGSAAAARSCRGPRSSAHSGSGVRLRVTVDPGRGAERVTDAAPNAPLYPVDATYVVCEEYRDGIKRRRIAQDFYCFKDRFQTWVCGSGEKFPQITQLD